jgi:hypothetical protein
VAASGCVTAKNVWCDLSDKLEEGKLALLTDRSKRTKKAGADSPSYESAGSREEPVREQ